MYKVYCDGLLLYHSKLENLKISNPSLDLELNKTGAFDFVIYSDHPYYGMIKKLTSIITVTQDDYPLFRGRVLDEDVGWHNEKNIVCEGDMAFLLDSVLRPFSFSGTVADFLSYVLSLHNPQVDGVKQFQIGTVTVDGNINYDATDYINTKETIEKALLEPFGGYIKTRFEDGVAYLDYVKEFNLLAPQTIEFGKNLLDLKRIRKGGDIGTVLIPLGAKVKDADGKDTEQRLTIASVNGGADFIQDDDAVAEFGVIVKTAIFEDITDPAELKTAGQAQLAEIVNQWESIELTAADLATVDKKITSFHLGTQVDAKSKHHGLDHRFLVSKLSIKPLEPGANKLTLGRTQLTFSEAVKGVSNGQALVLEAVEKTAQANAEAVYNLEQNTQASIQLAEGNITSAISEKVYLKEETEALISEVSTKLEQTASGFEMQFTQFNADVAAVAANVDAEFEERRRYIRFEDGNIIQGAEDSPFQKVQSATKESYYDNGKEVAYFSNQMLHVTDGEFNHSLRIGRFAFMPRANGNVSFKKVVE
jgi:phage minor structural protein